MKAFDIEYHSTRCGEPCVKYHRFVVENKQSAIDALFRIKYEV